MRKTRTAHEENRRTGLEILIVIIAILAVIYAAGCFYYSTHFYGSNTVFGISVRNKSVEALKARVGEKVGTYTLTIETRNGNEVLTAAEAGVSYDDRGEIDALMEEQKAYQWVLMFRSEEYDQDVAVKVDESVLTASVEALECMQARNMTAPTDAYLSYEDAVYVIVPETYGNTLEFETVYPLLLSAAYNGEESISLDDEDAYVPPEIFEDTAALVSLCETANGFVGAEITYDFSDRFWVVDGETIAGWLEFADDFSYSWDEEQIASYVYNMAYETDTFGLTHTFTTTGGSTITLKGGDYGWCINQSATVAQLIELIEAGEQVSTEPIYRYSGLCRATDDIGDSYVEVSISAQKMWVYKDGACVVSTDVVTGCVQKEYDTPTGSVWAIDGKLTNYTLTGQDYAAEVSNWLPYNGNVGIHDATWRKEFGSDIYLKNGSHGCVNTPLSAMKTVYETVTIGYPVVVY